MGRVAALLAVALVAACFVKPDRPSNMSTDAGNTADADACTAVVHDLFGNTASMCPPWATQTGDGTVAVASGTLNVTPAASPGATSCNSIPFQFAAGASVRIQAPLTFIGDATFLAVTTQTGGQSATIRIGATTGGAYLYLTDTDGTQLISIPYNTTTMRYFKLEPNPTSTAIHASYSELGDIWMLVGTVDVSGFPIEAVSLSIGASTAIAQTAPGTAILDDLNVLTCPP